MPRKILNLIAISIICMGATAAFATPHMGPTLFKAKCESTDGKGKCECKGACSADDTSCTCA